MSAPLVGGNGRALETVAADPLPGTSDAESHDAITEIPGSFDKTIRGLENLDAFKDVVSLTNTVITRLSYQHLPGLVERLGELKNLARMDNGICRPTAAAVLVYGNDPLSLVAGALIEFVRYDGVDVDSPVIRRRSVTGTLPDQLDTVWTQLNANIADLAVREEGMRTEYLPDYPIKALKELFSVFSASGAVYNDQLTIYEVGSTDCCPDLFAA